MKNKLLYVFVVIVGMAGSVVLTSDENTSSSSLLYRKAPFFKAQAVFPPDHEIGEFVLQKYVGTHNIVLYFYPMDDTPGCSKQAQKFRDGIERLKSHGIMVVGISCDSIKSHLKFQEKYGLPYILVSDSRWKRTISKKYDAAGWFYSKRKTYLIDRKGIIVHIFEQVDIANQIDDIIEAFKDHASKEKHGGSRSKRK